MRPQGDHSVTRTSRRAVVALLLVLAALAAAAPALAQAPVTPPAAPAVQPPQASSATQVPKIDSGDTAWVLTSTALVLLMTAPGLALFYGGMVRQKNALGTLMQSFIVLALISIQWVLWGYSLAFGPDRGGLIGGLDWFGLRGVGAAPNPDYAATIPHQAFMLFQMMFAVITPALITGAFAERKRFSTFLIFIVAWATLVYDPLAHWVWGAGGWLRNLGALDFAGGTVVHISSGISALAAALVIGRRKGYGHSPMPPHNLPMTVMGASLLWFGWFGFNAGSALAANGLAAHAFTTTNTATAAAALGWMFTEWSSRGKPTVLGAASGAVAGLVAVTPAAGFVTPMAAIVIGAVAGVLCYTACNFKTRLGYDDSLDVVGVHGVGGTWGALATGLFATKAVNDAGGDGLFYGNPHQLWVQIIAIVVTWILGFVVTAIILKVLDAVMGLRVSDEDEVAGLDLSQHSETAYVLGGSSYGEYSVGGGSGAFAEAMKAAEAKARAG
ncbi:MAG TPA: ammonium transporter, partial [Methylomirabilota bacterium]|nr:ammonium transporter [Methylomirabilota bacterium]